MRPSSSLGGLGPPKVLQPEQPPADPTPEMGVSRFALYLPQTMVKTHISLQEEFHGRERTVGQKRSAV